MKDPIEKRWHLDRFQKAALYWNNLANQQVFELNRQLISLAFILLPLTASIVAVEFIKLAQYQKTLLLLAWVFLFVSIIAGLKQIEINAKYFIYLSRDSSQREVLWSKDDDNETIKDQVEALGTVKPSSQSYPTLFQAFFVFTGLLFIMIVAGSILIVR